MPISMAISAPTLTVQQGRLEQALTEIGKRLTSCLGECSYTDVQRRRRFNVGDCWLSSLCEAPWGSMNVEKKNVGGVFVLIKHPAPTLRSSATSLSSPAPGAYTRQLFGST